MSGQKGNKRVSTKGLTVERIDADRTCSPQGSGTGGSQRLRPDTDYLNPLFKSTCEAVPGVASPLFLSRRPVHRTAAEQVDVEVGDRLPSVGTGVDDQAVARCG